MQIVIDELKKVSQELTTQINALEAQYTHLLHSRKKTEQPAKHKLERLIHTRCCVVQVLCTVYGVE
jgi:uncharacterized protein YoxC